jgi:hypothetical protein
MTHIAALFMKFESHKKAKISADRFKLCPKVHFWANSGEAAYIILKVPNNQKFWSDFVVENPEKSFGGLEAQITYLDELVTPEKIEISYEKNMGDVTPCGSRCKTCPTLGVCPGCPALILDTP